MGRQMDLLIDQSTWVHVYFDRSTCINPNRRTTRNSDHLSAIASPLNIEITLKFQKITHSIGRRPFKIGQRQAKDARSALHSGIIVPACSQRLAGRAPKFFPLPFDFVRRKIKARLRHYLSLARFDLPLVLHRARRGRSWPLLCAASSPAFLPPPLPPFVR
jgi:hypothetical protein